MNIKKKVLMIDHSYHKKTQSSLFFSKLLDEQFDLEIQYDESWREENGEELNLEFADEMYSAVIFFQSISAQMMHQVKCKNIIYVPMYDGVHGLGLDYWDNFRNIKILSFSSTLYNYLKAEGFNVEYFQYFPRSKDLNIVEDKRVFFWSRVNAINWNVVKKLLGEEDIQGVHIHKAIDPSHEFTKPAQEDEEGFNISYSDWFETKSEYYECLKKQSMYISPRLYEGIGFSFLEAMAMGKVVISVDNPTMNEYIVHGENGLLFSIDDIKPIMIEDIKLLQVNAYNTIVDGRKQWEDNIPRMLDYIENANILVNVDIVQPINESEEFIAEEGGRIELINKPSKKMGIAAPIKKIIKCLMPYGMVRIYQKYLKK